MYPEHKAVLLFFALVLFAGLAAYAIYATTPQRVRPCPQPSMHHSAQP